MLVEILVSLVVIAVLVALASGALRGARDAARSAACLVNLRTLGNAVLEYTHDSGGVMPYADRLIDARGGEAWLAPLPALERYVGVAPPAVGPEGRVVTAALFRCPADRVVAPETGMSYSYMPAAFMEVMPVPDPARAVSLMYRDDWRMPIWVDTAPSHVGVTPRGRNRFLFDGTVGPQAVGE